MCIWKGIEKHHLLLGKFVQNSLALVPVSSAKDKTTKWHLP